MNCKVITFNIGTGAVGTTVTVTPGFPTKLGLVFLAGRTDATDANGAADHSRGVGFFVGTTSGKGMASASRDAHPDKKTNGGVADVHFVETPHAEPEQGLCLQNTRI